MDAIKGADKVTLHNTIPTPARASGTSTASEALPTTRTDSTAAEEATQQQLNVISSFDPFDKNVPSAEVRFYPLKGLYGPCYSLSVGVLKFTPSV